MNIVEEDKIPEKVNASSKVPGKKSVYGAPPGYLPIEMSTEGRFGVPKVVHVKNFTTEFLVDLSLANNELLPERLINSLQSLIWEKEVEVANWPEPMAIELLVKIYANFFTPVLTSVDFPVYEEDLTYLEEKGKSAQKKDIEEGKFIPKIDIDLRSFHSLPLDPKAKDFIRYEKKDKTFSVKMRSYIRLKDSVLIRKAVEEAYRETDKKYAKIKQDIELRSVLLSKEKYDNLPVIDDYEFLEWKAYEAQRTLFTIQLAKAVGLVEYNGKNVDDLPLDEKAKIVESDAHFDADLSKLIDKQVEKLRFGIDPEIEVKNPITGEVCKRAFTFRLLDILQAVQLSESTEYDFCYDD